MKKFFSVLLIGCLSAGLVGCGNNSPEDAANGFLKSFRDGEFKEASTYVDEGSINDIAKDKTDEELAEKMMKSISNRFTYTDVKELSTSGDRAKVSAKITSPDVGTAMTEAIAKVMPIAFASAFDESSKKSDQAMENLMVKTVVKKLEDKDSQTVTRTVKLNLKKDKEGNYKLVADKQLEEVVFANMKDLNDLFDGQSSDAASSDGEVSGDTPKQSSKVVTNVLENKTYTIDPIKLNIKQVAIKHTKDVPEDEQSNITLISDKEIGNEFNYLYIKYLAENTSDKDYIFNAIKEAVVFSDGKQERLEVDSGLDFIDYDEDNDGVFYGKVNKEGEVGLVIDSDPTKVDKIRLVLGATMEDNDEYEVTTDEQTVEFTVNK
ncbi:DUF4878 domain-containing protein [Fictibacillus enclensis]|uniref:DUF4878 domain-containing protein n=1 Tax=Fictibacillus enclensis TaxID=1017270 RepID=UPI00259FE3DE|nr:DUF4878 domain-containing protein [Fictibacillus enclensis]MDM5338490.1 DUF4878 domain-containing protein [Fictibacillus enclensis]